jgi:23S rRNA pseudouridine2605 synthase
MQPCRLNRFLASRGVASRRACDEIIRAGRVRVNGATVLLPGTRVMPGTDVVELEGHRLAQEPEPKYIMLNKPAGVIVTAKDTRKRKAVTELIPASLGRLFPVGRLDLNTEGLLLLTNDGPLAFRMTHPSYGVEKTYEVLVKGRPKEPALKALREGVDFGEGLRSSPAKVSYLGSRRGRQVKDGDSNGGHLKDGQVKDGHLIRVVISEGKKRQVRRMCKAVGLIVLSLVRTGFGPLELGELPTGSWRELKGSELKALMACVKEKPEGSSG